MQTPEQFVEVHMGDKLTDAGVRQTVGDIEWGHYLPAVDWNDRVTGLIDTQAQEEYVTLHLCQDKDGNLALLATEDDEDMPLVDGYFAGRLK